MARSVMQAILSLCLFGAALGYTNLRFTSCSTASDSGYVTIRDFGLRDHPVVIPGHLYPTATLDVHQSIRGHLRLDVSVQKYLIFDYYELPCMSNVGSCSYDLCDLLDWFRYRGCPWQLRASEFPCTCPIQDGTYHLEPRPFHIGELPILWQWLAFGDYRVRGRLMDTRTNTEVGCYELEFTAQQRVNDDIWAWLYV